jgi:hypothetical protein
MMAVVPLIATLIPLPAIVLVIGNKPLTLLLKSVILDEV